MPHLTIQYSPLLAQRHDIAALCDNLRQVMIGCGCFPTGGIRVRAWSTPAQSIADGHPENSFADMVLRMAAGRSATVKTAAGQAIMAAAESFFSAELDRPHFALSLEIVDISPEFSWKTNSIHARLNKG